MKFIKLSQEINDIKIMVQRVDEYVNKYLKSIIRSKINIKN